MNLIDTDCLPETTDFNDRFAKANGLDRSVTLDAATIAALRRNRLGSNEPAVRLPQGHDRTVAGVGVREFRPPEYDGVYLHIHGGSWTFGSAASQDEELWRLARTARLAVLSIEYRLAPEYALPAGAEDCLAVARWLVAHARAEFGTDRLLIGGESAGAHLSVLTLLGLDEPGAFRAAHLSYGPYDLGMTPSQRLFGSRPLLSNTETLRATYALCLPGLDPEERRSPAISPLYADLTGLPPARLAVGAEDPLLDDSVFLAARWSRTGVPVDLDVIAGAMHAFTLFPLTVTDRERDRRTAYLRSA
jgi:acetyl esterase